MDVRRGAFSLVEILAVLGVISILFGLALPAVERTRESANRVRCIANMKQISLALHGYHDRTGHLPAGTTNSLPADQRYLGWHTRLLPDIEEGPRWDEVVAAFRQDPNLTHIPPHSNAERGISLYQCPSDCRGPVARGAGRSVGLTAYLGNTGLSRSGREGVLFTQSAIRFADVVDGASQTLLIGERPAPAEGLFGWYGGPGLGGSGSTTSHLGVRELSDEDGKVYCPWPTPFVPSSPASNCGYLHFWSFHPGGANFAFCDGSVRFLQYSADRMLPALSTRNGGEVAGLDD
jgi:prepilin-type processing-associated H-X9-DG protein